MIRAGTLRERITLTHSTSTEDARWGPTPTANLYATVSADVEPVSATERIHDGGVQSEITHTICMRYRSDVTSKDVVTWRGKRLEIVSVIDVGNRHVELELDCKELPSNG